MATESKSKYFHSLGELQADQEMEQALKDDDGSDWKKKQEEIEQAFKVLSDREEQKKKLKQRKDMSDGFRPKESDAFVDAPHYKDPRLEKPALQLPAFDNPQDYSIGTVPAETDVDAPNSFLLAGIFKWIKDPKAAATEIGGIVAKEEMDRDKAQKILGEDVTIGEDIDWSGVNPKLMEIGKHLLQDPSLNDFMGRKTFLKSFIQSYLFSPTDPLYYLYPEWTDKEVTSARRTIESPFFEQGSAHNTGNALDLRASWDKNEVTKEELLEKKVQPSLTKAGWKMIPTTKDGSVATVKTEKTSTEKAKDQAWMKFTKNGETLFIELDDRNQHLHFHLGKNQLEPKEQWE